VDLDKDIDIADLTPGARVALRNDRCGQACHSSSSSSSSSATDPTQRCAAAAPSLVICFWWLAAGLDGLTILNFSPTSNGHRLPAATLHYFAAVSTTSGVPRLLLIVLACNLLLLQLCIAHPASQQD
jgi:hypothetical protein